MTRTQNYCCDNTRVKITRHIVPDEDRINILPEHFGILAMVFEGEVYGWLKFLAKEYSGGYWHFYRLSNGGFYMAPCLDRSFDVVNPGNHFEGTLSADAVGIAACCFAMGHLAFDYRDNDVFAVLFHKLREFALDHDESALILRLID